MPRHKCAYLHCFTTSGDQKSLFGFPKDRYKEFHNSPVVASTVSNLEHGHVNPIANGEFTIFTPLSPEPQFNNNVFLANQQVIRRTSNDNVYGDIDVSKWFAELEKDFPRSKLKYIRELGKGCFGRVVEGAAQDLDTGRTWTPVVVRILDATASPRERILFLNDALFYLAPAHPNILALKGRCLTAVPFLLLQESCTGGDLKSRLRSVGSGDNVLEWCCQLTSALRHLHDHGFIHPDLAARNCLLTDCLTLKLGDYSLSTAKYPEDYYKGGEPLIPVRWRSPESLDCTPTTIKPKLLTKEGNVWSLGVVMWEICENGSQPYGLLDDDEVISRVFGPEGLRLDGPSNPQMYSDYIFRLIRMCWSNAESRPNVSQISMMLSDLLQVHKNTQDVPNSTDDFDKRWHSLKPNTIVKTDNQNTTIDIESDIDQNHISKLMSPSLNNLHGSLDNLSSVSPVMPSLPSGTQKPNHLKSLDSTVKASDHFGVLENVSKVSGDSVKPDLNLKRDICFELGVSQRSTSDKLLDSQDQNDSLTDSMIFKQGSSESDTEEENWRRKVERGAYSEKVRLKSRSVADLMVLTHVDYSESESETPMPSIDYRSNRTFRKSNLENSSLNFSSEGNLLSIEDTFEKELKKLQVERRDSLLFVPDNKSQNNSNLSLLHELNSPTEIKPMNQIYNIFNMTIDRFGPLRVSASKLNDIINIGDEAGIFSRQDSENKSDLGYATLHNSERNSDFGSVDSEYLLEDKNLNIKSEIEERLKNSELLAKYNLESPTSLEDVEEYNSQEKNSERCSPVRNEMLEESVLMTKEKNHCYREPFTASEVEDIKPTIFPQMKQNLPDILASLDQDHGNVSVDLLESNLLPTQINNDGNYIFNNGSVYNDETEREGNTLTSYIINAVNAKMMPESTEYKKNYMQNMESHKHESDKQIIVPKLSDLVLDNPKLVQFISDKLHSDEENVIYKKLVTKESQIVPDLYSENLESSDSVSNSVLERSRDINKEKASKRNPHDITPEDELNPMSSAKMEIFTESLLPEIKQTFTKGPNILDSINSTELKTYLDVRKSETSGKVPENIPTEESDRIFSINARALSNPPSKEVDLFLNAERSNVFVSASEIHRIDIDHLGTEISVEDYQNGPYDICDLNAKIDDYVAFDRADNVSDFQDVSNPITLNEQENSPAYFEEHSTDMADNTSRIVSCKLQSKLGNDICEKEDIEKSPLNEVSDAKPKITFDLSESQQETMPNYLTHTAVFTSTPFRKKQDLSLPTEQVYSSLNLFGAQENPDDNNEFLSSFGPLESNNSEKENVKLNYSLETWDNFLGKSFDSNRESNETLFDSFTSEPQSLLFLDDCSQKEIQVGEKESSSAFPQNTDGTFIKGSPLSDGQPSVRDHIKDSTFVKDNTFVRDGTFVIEETNNGTFVKDKEETFIGEDKKDETFVLEKADGITDKENPPNGEWQTGGGWFLHPQSNSSMLAGNIEPQPSTSKGSYIGFGVDDEIMTAIRNELLEKLPHAQVKGGSQESVKEEEEWNQTERNEVFLRYNVYNTPLSPIPEENSFDENDEELVVTGENSPKLNDTDSDWSDGCELEYPPALSSHTNDSPVRLPSHVHTPSQSSCCSNDTLFNFDDFGSVNEKEIEQAENVLNDDVFEKENGNKDFEGEIDDKLEKCSDDDHSKTYSCSENQQHVDLQLECHSHNEPVSDVTIQATSLEAVVTTSSQDLSSDTLSLGDFLNRERMHTSSACSSLPFRSKVVAPLPSPEDKPWKSLPASLLTYDTIQKPTLAIDGVDVSPNREPITLNEKEDGVLDSINDSENKTATPSSETALSDEPTNNIDINKRSLENIVIYENIPASTLNSENGDTLSSLCEDYRIYEENDSSTYKCSKENCHNIHPVTEIAEYEKSPASHNSVPNDVTENYINRDEDYVDIEKLKEIKNISINDKGSPGYANDINQHHSLIMDDHNGDDHDIFGVLTDIRFSGPIDNQLMSTSFSESNDVDEQDWDSGSDTRSSSSGEFIWKEGEHEESLKALTAAPHDVLDDIKPMEEITEETTDSDVSTSDDEGENLEFVPSAWDKFATPTKSALRSPEKSLERSDSKKSKGVWFKKQKYHCVYEYPREPESPVLHSHDLWKPQIDYAAFSDWEFDAESYLPPPTAEGDINPSTFTYKSKINNSRRSLYYLTSPNEIRGYGSSISSNSHNDFIIPPSCRSLDTNSEVCSQFFPGASSWSENVTPDSGLEDCTPGSIGDCTDYPENYLVCRQVLPLKKLAAQVINRNKEVNRGSKDVLGGLRHTRNKLKLDLPPSPSAFTSSKAFTVEPLQEPVILREKPTFSTFGKSRFLVQHVDTPTDDNLQENKNVCFDVLPYKPINIIPVNSSESQKNNDILYEPLKINFDDMSEFSNKKEMFVKGEASLLDSADEDSGIESSTLERKMSNVVHKENAQLE